MVIAVVCGESLKKLQKNLVVMIVRTIFVPLLNEKIKRHDKRTIIGFDRPEWNDWRESLRALK